eukprot:scaffold388_cov244-Pinguiococcus_pyrenoidosus.AAC.10
MLTCPPSPFRSVAIDGKKPPILVYDSLARQCSPTSTFTYGTRPGYVIKCRRDAQSQKRTQPFPADVAKIWDALAKEPNRPWGPPPPLPAEAHEQPRRPSGSASGQSEDS